MFTSKFRDICHETFQSLINDAFNLIGWVDLFEMIAAHTSTANNLKRLIQWKKGKKNNGKKNYKNNWKRKKIIKSKWNCWLNQKLFASNEKQRAYEAHSWNLKSAYTHSHWTHRPDLNKFYLLFPFSFLFLLCLSFFFFSPTHKHTHTLTYTHTNIAATRIVQ